MRHEGSLYKKRSEARCTDNETEGMQVSKEGGLHVGLADLGEAPSPPGKDVPYTKCTVSFNVQSHFKIHEDSRKPRPLLH